ncbi:hypothetical protein ACIBF1_32590 [Spirillospora sp. NPDC050679]
MGDHVSTTGEELPVFSPAEIAQPLQAAHPTCNHALVADLFDEGDEG